MNAILDATRASDGASYIEPEIARQALVACLASIIEADGRVRTRRDMREVSDRTAKELLRQIEALRAHFERTGKRSGWDAKSVRMH